MSISASRSRGDSGPSTIDAQVDGGPSNVAIDLSSKSDNPPVEPEVLVDIKVEPPGEDEKFNIDSFASSLSNDSFETSGETDPMDQFVMDQVLEDTEEGDQPPWWWVRIPVTMVELWANKDGPADISRTAKVKFPGEWGGESIIKYINGFDPRSNVIGEGSSYNEARVWHYDHDLEEYQVSHYGFVGGVGPATESGVMKMWIYDPADMMKGIHVSQSWGEPSIPQVVDFALNGVDEQGNLVGLNNRTTFNNVGSFIAGVQDIPQQKRADVRDPDPGTFNIEGSLPIVGSFSIEVPGLIGDLFEYINNAIIDPLLGGQKRFQLNRHNMIDYIDWFTGLIDARWHFEPSASGPVLFIDATAYKPGDDKGKYERRNFVEQDLLNKRPDLFDYEGNMDDIIDGYSDVQRGDEVEVDYDAGTDLRLDAEEWYGDQLDDPPNASDPFVNPSMGLLQESDQDLAGENMGVPYGAVDTFGNGDKQKVFAAVDTVHNDALVDIKPFNTMRLYGEAATYRERHSDYESSGSPGGMTERYPYVKVQYPPLVSRANGQEYSAEPLESDEIYLEEAENKAINEFRKHLEESTEGEVEIKGEPHILPYDRITTIPVCDGMYENTNPAPITYEVNAVKHTCAAGERYTTNLGVSLTFDESKLDVNSEYQEA